MIYTTAPVNADHWSAGGELHAALAFDFRTGARRVTFAVAVGGEGTYPYVVVTAYEGEVWGGRVICGKGEGEREVEKGQED